MNSKLYIALSFSLLAGACASPEQHSQDMQALIKNCATRPPVPCNDAMPRNEVTINTASAIPTPNPRTVCADEGKDIEVTIQPQTSKVLVVTVPKDSKNGWILASNSKDPLKMTISVPVGTAGKWYDYLIITGDGKCLDPRIRVR